MGMYEACARDVCGRGGGLACGFEDPPKDGGIVDGEGRRGVDPTFNHTAPSHL